MMVDYKCYLALAFLLASVLLHCSNAATQQFLHMRSPDRLFATTNRLSASMSASQRKPPKPQGVIIPLQRNVSQRLSTVASIFTGSSSVNPTVLPFLRSAVRKTTPGVPKMTTTEENHHDNAVPSSDQTWEVLIASNCYSLKLNGQTVINNYRGPLYYLHHSIESQLYSAAMAGTAGQHEEVEQSKYTREGKKLQCVGPFENRCSRFDVSGEAFSVIVVGFSTNDAGIYRCLNEEGITTGEYEVHVRENQLPISTLNQPMLFIDIRPYTKQLVLMEQNVLGITLATVFGGLFFVVTVVVSVCFLVEDPSPGQLLSSTGNIASIASSSMNTLRATAGIGRSPQHATIICNREATTASDSFTGATSSVRHSSTGAQSKPSIVISRRLNSISADNSPASETSRLFQPANEKLLVPPSRGSQHRSSVTSRPLSEHASTSALTTEATMLQPPQLETRSISHELRMFRLAVHLTEQQKLEIERAQQFNLQQLQEFEMKKRRKSLMLATAYPDSLNGTEDEAGGATTPNDESRRSSRWRLT